MIMKNRDAIVFAVLTVLCWSSYNVAAKYGIDTGFSPEALTFLRFSVPGLIAIPYLALQLFQGGFIDVPISRLIMLVLLGGPLFGLAAVSGYNHAPLSHGLLFAPIAVFVTGCFLGRMLLNEHFSTNRLVGAAVMFVGLAILVGLEMRDLGDSWVQGISLFVLAGAMWGSYTVLLRLWNIPMIQGTLTIAAGSTLIAVPFLGPTTLEELIVTPTSSLMLQFMMQGVVGGIVSVATLIGAIRMIPSQIASLLPAFTPVVALALAAAMFAQVPSVAEMIGVVIVAGGFLINVGTKVSLKVCFGHKFCKNC